MRRRIGEARQLLQARAPQASFAGRFQTVAAYASLALITAIIIGSHSIHPF